MLRSAQLFIDNFAGTSIDGNCSSQQPSLPQRSQNRTPDLIASVSSSITPTVSPVTTPASMHSGQWQPKKEALEFVQLDADIKANMRKEKQRRLQEVQSQMAFIIDSDDPNEMPGAWTCCGKSEFSSECTCHQR